VAAVSFENILPNIILDESAAEYLHILKKSGCQEVFEDHTRVEECPTECNILLASAPLAEEFLHAGHSAKWIQSTWAGNAKLIPLLKQADTILTGVKGVFGPLIAEYVFAYLLPKVRGTKRSSDAQAENRWDSFEPDTLQGKEFVFIGTGSIGAHVANVARAFGMKTVGVSRSGVSLDGFDRMYPTDKLDQAIQTADFILLSVPETPASSRLIGKSTLAAVKPGATLINVGRGSTLDTAAVIDALEAGQLSLAVLDVFDTEPLPADSPLWGTPGVILTPHIAAVSYPQIIAEKFLNNLVRYNFGDELVDVIDPLIGY